MFNVSTIELSAEAAPVIQGLSDSGLLVVPSGRHVIRFLPPLNVTDAECDEALGIFARVLPAAERAVQS